VEEKWGYEGDVMKADALLVKMLGIKGSEWITSRADKLDALGLSGNAPGRESVTFFDPSGRELGGVIIGGSRKSSSENGALSYANSGYRYVKNRAEDDIFLATVSGRIDADPLWWIEKSLLEIPSKDVEKVELRHPLKKDSFSLIGKGDGTFEPEGLKKAKGKGFRNSVINDIAGAMKNLTIRDIMKRESEEAKGLNFDHSYVARLKDGREYAISTASRDGKSWLSIDVSYDGPSSDEMTVKEKERLAPWIFEVASAGSLSYRASDIIEQ
ncbi:MAG: DUF4340 domain-containing protein, partial [bacterium]|nr:DUF4340 domain-containing protein [bacterium]